MEPSDPLFGGEAVNSKCFQWIGCQHHLEESSDQKVSSQRQALRMYSYCVPLKPPHDRLLYSVSSELGMEAHIISLFLFLFHLDSL